MSGNHTSKIELEIAADRGDAQAQFGLGVRYYRGSAGAIQDYIVAHMWLNLAAAQGHEQARAQRDFLTQIMTTEQLAAAQEMARRWKPPGKAADH